MIIIIILKYDNSYKFETEASQVQNNKANKANSLNKAIPLFKMGIFLLNACRNLILYPTTDQDVFKKKNYMNIFSHESEIRMNNL